MKQYKVAVLGLGNSGWNIHCRCLGNMPERFKITAVFDMLEQRCEKAERELGCKAYYDYGRMFEQCDADIVVNALPSNMHVPVSSEALEKGFDVICEKPLTNSLDEIDSLIRCVKKTGKIFTVFHDLRVSPHFQQVRSVIQSGILGRIVQISMYADFFQRNWNWQVMRKYNGGRLLNAGSHMIDKALQLTDSDFMPEITCIMDKAASFGDAEDYVKLVLKAPGYPVFDLEMSACCVYPPFAYNVQGTCGGLTGGTNNIKWKYFKPWEVPARTASQVPITDKDGDPAYCREELKWYEETWEDSRSEFDVAPVVFYEALYDTLENGAPLLVTLQQVRRQIVLIEECKRSYDT